MGKRPTISGVSAGEEHPVKKALGPILPVPVVQAENTSASHGKYRVQFDKAMFGLINGGGPEMQLTTFNGNIYIRKAK